MGLGTKYIGPGTVTVGTVTVGTVTRKNQDSITKCRGGRRSAAEAIDLDQVRCHEQQPRQEMDADGQGIYFQELVG